MAGGEKHVFLEDVVRVEWPASDQGAGDRDDYLHYYARLKDQPLPVSRATGKLLYILARSIGAGSAAASNRQRIRALEGRAGARQLYLPILGLLEDRLRSGALIVADNADTSPEYVARARSAANDYLSVPFTDDVELSMCLGPRRRTE